MQIRLPQKIGKWEKITVKTAIDLLMSDRSLFLTAFYKYEDQYPFEQVMSNYLTAQNIHAMIAKTPSSKWRTVDRVRSTDIIFTGGSHLFFKNAACYIQDLGDGCAIMVGNYGGSSSMSDAGSWNYKVYYMEG